MKPLSLPINDVSADFAKGIGIVLVVVGHVLRGLFSADILPSAGVWQILDNMIYLFHMPLFFFISGLFMRQSIERYGYSSVLKKTAYVLLVPLIVWSYLQFSLQYAAGGSVNNPVSLNYLLLAPFPPKQQFWFLGVLFVAFLVTAAILRLGISSRGRFIIVLCLFSLQIIFWRQISDYLGSGQYLFLALQTLIHLPYLLLATVIGRDSISTLRISWPISIAIFALCVCIPTLLLSELGMVQVLFSILCVLSLYKACQGYIESGVHAGRGRFLAFLGMNSMIIFLAHVIIAAGFRIVLIKIGVSDPAVHLIGGVSVGVFGPLLLIPISIKLCKIHPQFNLLLPARMARG